MRRPPDRLDAEVHHARPERPDRMAPPAGVPQVAFPRRVRVRLGLADAHRHGLRLPPRRLVAVPHARGRHAAAGHATTRAREAAEPRVIAQARMHGCRRHVHVSARMRWRPATLSRLDSCRGQVQFHQQNARHGTSTTSSRAVLQRDKRRRSSRAPPCRRGRASRSEFTEGRPSRRRTGTFSPLLPHLPGAPLHALLTRDFFARPWRRRWRAIGWSRPAADRGGGAGACSLIGVDPDGAAYGATGAPSSTVPALRGPAYQPLPVVASRRATIASKAAPRANTRWRGPAAGASHSAHWLAPTAVRRDAVADFLEREGRRSSTTSTN